MGSELSIAQMQAEAKSLGCPNQGCPRCKADGGFRRHDCRSRQVLAIVAGFVVTCVICLKRWKCCSCEATFTHYPEFLVPYKRHLLSTVLAMGEVYVTDPEASYRDVVQPEEMPLGYAEEEDGTIDERQMSHTTLWHWLTWLGNLTALADQAADLLRQKDPGFELHRAVTPVFPGKYRGMERRCILEQAAALMRTGRQFMRLFSRRIFPTLCNNALFAPG